ncbi:MAG: enoyl-CoA hydratase/isomerase family protein [Candidatus Methylomirabilales bacterium]
MAKSESPVLYSKDDQIARIRFNRPQRLNAVSQAMYGALEACFAGAGADPEVRAIVLTGEGRAFSVGADLKAHGEGERTAAEKRAYVWTGQRACAVIRDCPKPVIAAVNGYALGAGAEMALSCDFVIMAEEAEMGFPEVGIGTFVGGGLTSILPRLVGLNRAKELILLGERFAGRQAADMGLILKAVPLERLEEEVGAFAARLVSKAPISVRLAKEQLNRNPLLDLKTAMVCEAEALLACMASEDWAEGLRAFAERRAPRFRGT